MGRPTLTDVNPFYLGNVMDLAREHEVVTSDDIYSAQGMKLVARGRRVDESLYERLINFSLRTPLESCLAVGDGVRVETLMEEAEALLEEVGPLSALMRTTNSTRKAMSVLKETRLDQVGALLITMEKGMGTLPHSVLVSLFCLAVGIGLNLGEDNLRVLVMAGMLHDAGELYIDREYLKPNRRLQPREWKHVAVHPHIGELVIREVAGYPERVAAAVGEHHERPNGFGYPRRITGDRMSVPGKILMAGEALGSLFTRDRWSVRRVSLAVSFIPGEYPPEIVSLIASIPVSDESADSGKSGDSVDSGELDAPGSGRKPRGASPGGAAHADAPLDGDQVAWMKRIDNTIIGALDGVEQALAREKVPSARSAFLQQVRKRLLVLQAAMRDTVFSPHEGLYADTDCETETISLEIRTVIHEIEWRLREVSRHMALNSMAGKGDTGGSDDSGHYFDWMADCLDRTPANAPRRAGCRHAA